MKLARYNARGRLGLAAHCGALLAAWPLGTRMTRERLVQDGLTGVISFVLLVYSFCVLIESLFSDSYLNVT